MDLEIIQFLSQLLLGLVSMFALTHVFCNFQEYTGSDDSDLFLEEREAALRKAQEEKRRVQLSVPGMLNPHELPEDMQD